VRQVCLRQNPLERSYSISGTAERKAGDQGKIVGQVCLDPDPEPSQINADRDTKQGSKACQKSFLC
jgi:hypothetical protein